MMKQIFKIRKMAQELDPEEAKLKAQLEPEVARVLAPKRILLWAKLLQVSQYQDKGIVDMVKRGIPLHGEHDYPQIFPAAFDGAVWRRCALQASSSSDYSLDSKEEDLHAATMEEVGLGHLQGPFTKQQIDERFGRMLGFSPTDSPSYRVPQRTRRFGWLMIADAVDSTQPTRSISS